MAEFKKLSEVEQIETASDNATVLVEENGEIKRVPKKEVGGGGIETLIIKDLRYDVCLGGGTAESTDGCPYTCINMSFEEAHQLISEGEPITAVMMIIGGSSAVGYAPIFVWYTDLAFGVPSLAFQTFNNETFFWTLDGFSYTIPSSGEPS